ncbi:unnamed protein product [Rotaria socialis]|nr:unnamed protein product [Rotaria socialis]
MGNAIIGNNPTFVPLEGTNVFQGYIDKLTVSRRPKSAYEILEEATLAARFPFDNTTILVDFGPNAVSANASSYSILTNGHSLQAIGFNGSMSYFQTWGFTQFIQKWSSTNGRNLYVNNIVVDSQPSTTTFAASGITPNYVTLANSLLGSGSCGVVAINSNNSFIGGVDDFRIYSRELSATDVCALYLG